MNMKINHSRTQIIQTCFLLATVLIGSAITGCSTDVDESLECDENGVCSDPSSAAEDEAVAESQDALRKPTFGNGPSCTIIQCDGLQNPFGELVCIFGVCVCVAGDKSAGCKSGETTCREKCGRSASPPPGAMAP